VIYFPILVIFYNNLLLRNIYLIHLVVLFHIQNSADEFLFPAYAGFLFYKKDQTHHHNQEDKEHRDKRYGGVAG